MCLDICPPAGATRAEHEEAVRRTTALGTSSRSTRRGRPGSCGSESPRAAPIPSSAAARSRRSSRSAFDGNALGGLAVGESRAEMLETVGWAAPLLPADRPRYFMGLGDIEGHPRA